MLRVAWRPPGAAPCLAKSPVRLRARSPAVAARGGIRPAARKPQENLVERIEHRACFGGWQDVYRHASMALGCAMNVAVYLPPQAAQRRCPVLYWLSGLTCTEQN